METPDPRTRELVQALSELESAAARVASLARDVRGDLEGEVPGPDAQPTRDRPGTSGQSDTGQRDTGQRDTGQRGTDEGFAAAVELAYDMARSRLLDGIKLELEQFHARNVALRGAEPADPVQGEE